MNDIDISKYASKINPIDILIRAKEAKKYLGETNLDEKKVEDAIAYALAAGVRLGIEAVIENKT